MKISNPKDETCPCINKNIIGIAWTLALFENVWKYSCVTAAIKAISVSAENIMETISKVSYKAWENNRKTSDKDAKIYPINHGIKSLLLKHIPAKINVAKIMTRVVDKFITK